MRGDSSVILVDASGQSHGGADAEVDISLGHAHSPAKVICHAPSVVYANLRYRITRPTQLKNAGLQSGYKAEVVARPLDSVFVKCVKSTHPTQNVSGPQRCRDFPGVSCHIRNNRCP